VILETIVTSVSPTGVVNCAPMGVEWDPPRVVLKPFVDTTTFANVAAGGAAVVNIIDDVRVFAESALGTRTWPTVPAVRVAGVVLADACSWREVQVDRIDPAPPRARIETHVVHAGSVREFIGFNRARHAVLEATIHATRIHLLGQEFLEQELARLQVIVDKTAGDAERDAMAFVTAHVRRALATGGPRS